MVESTRHIHNYDKPCSSNRKGEKAITICLSITFIMCWYQLDTIITMTSPVLQIEKERRPSLSAHYIHHVVVSTRHIPNYDKPCSSNSEGEKPITLHYILHVGVSTRHIHNYDKPYSSNREGEKAIAICLSITFIMWWYQLDTFITMASHVLQIEKEGRP